ncbi:hypothetical protein BCR37DRAFT_393243 [Protomyces lactucae-debilis]|uniref:Uncharacterized protein n=1 Tax=Protomyces lactucae-debilis TaxID=2754530 RepID=A0A1Y2FBS4_PROLT|nr:uncharacterized protein BCR37DRAFT_393243 [Protomyces lactucae-debilis]ORY81368.1 hypothetical protein BCR37DRAFT_393243 [Protomyces lactucae-debilis]
MRVSWRLCCAASLLAGRSAYAQTSTRDGEATSVANVPTVQDATVAAQPSGVTVEGLPDPSKCNYTDNDLYCFPTAGAFVRMTGWTRFFYNKNYGLLKNVALVDVTMYFATNDAPAATWIGVGNTGDIPINVNISWFTSTLAPVATQQPGVRGVADPYYFYVRPNSAVYNALPTVSSKGPTFYAVQTPRVLAAAGISRTTGSQDPSSAAASQTAAPTAGNTATSGLGTNTTQSNGGSNNLSPGAIAGIVIGAIALVVALGLLAFIILLILRRERHWKREKEALQDQARKDRDEKAMALGKSRPYGPALTDAELEVAGLTIAAPSRDTTPHPFRFPGQYPYIERVGGSRPRPQRIKSNQGDYSFTSGDRSIDTSAESSPAAIIQTNPFSYARTGSESEHRNSHAPLSPGNAGYINEEKPPVTADSETTWMASEYTPSQLARKPSIMSVSDNVARASKAKLVDVKDHRPPPLPTEGNDAESPFADSQISPRSPEFPGSS